MVNILIAIVTGEYEKAQARSCELFARSRLEAAARQGKHSSVHILNHMPSAPFHISVYITSC